MCGIAGFWSCGSPHLPSEALIDRMTEAIAHRGPDGAGRWLDPHAGVALGHRRLAIVDLSAAGAQPMCSASGRYVIVFNGEIYNFVALRAELETKGARFDGHSDTAVMLEAIEAWGLEAALSRFVGMFAFALWDVRERRLILARDRMGEKPLYYGWAGRSFLFGSELHALRAHPGFNAGVDRDALASYMRFGYVPAPHTIHAGLFKLLPGTVLVLQAPTPGVVPLPRPYWSLAETARDGLSEPFGGTDGEAISALEGLLSDAVAGQMMADVPLGAFLSGGIDSSTIVALMQARSARPIKTFTIGFDEPGYDEAAHAQAVARHLGTDHTALRLDATDALMLVPRLATLYDEPFADSSQLPTLLVSSLARRHVTVALSGDGGDELFGGYSRYALAEARWERLAPLPIALRAGLARGLMLLHPEAWAPPGLADRAERLAHWLRSETPEAFYRHLVSGWDAPARLLIGGRDKPDAWSDPHRQLLLSGPLDRMRHLDMQAYLPDDILAKVDRAAMGVSLETRVPLLDHRVVAFAWSLPPAMVRRDGQTKWLLRQLLTRHVPRALVERPKMGFAVPLEHWLRGPLRDWAEHLLAPERLSAEGYFDPTQVRRIWTAHLERRGNWLAPLWTVIMFQAWHEAMRHAPAALSERRHAS